MLHGEHGTLPELFLAIFFLLAALMACESSWARDQTRATVAACTTAAAMPDP